MDDVTDLRSVLKDIVKQATELKNKHTGEKGAPVNYAAVFAQSDIEYNMLLKSAKIMGKIVEETKTGPLFRIAQVITIAGDLRLVKIRMPDVTRPERGDADFTVPDYFEFKRTYLSKPGFKLIRKDNFEMIELMDPQFNVRAYFSHPPIDEQLESKATKK